MTAVDAPNPAIPLRVAVVGAGPAGIYTADALLKKDPNTEVDIFDRLPVPFGLLRYGVAPDHLKMKILAGTLQKVLDQPTVRFFGNVTLGRDVTAEELVADYHAVVYTFGASADRPMGIPGEELDGNVAATDFVAWYSGHPDAGTYDLTGHRAVAVIGLGNVALDVARVLVRRPEEMAETDVPDDVLAALRASDVREVHIVGRRGPEHVKFTIKELREMGELDDVDVIVDAAAFDGLGQSEDKNVNRLVAELRSWTDRPLTGASRRLHVHFYSPPAAIHGDGKVEALEVGRPGETRTLPVSMVLRSIGYLGVPAEGVPYDHATSTIPTSEHRVVGGAVALGEYAAGWIKRGATGVIGTNRSDASETVAVLLADRDLLMERQVTPGSALALITERIPRLVTLDGWAAIDVAEIELGTKRPNARVKLHTWDGLLDAAKV
ncbi:MAG: FAD-dependent oxidoreductase [Sporichthyaceae bacterium]